MILIRSPADLVKAKVPTHLAQFITKLITSITTPPEHIISEDDGHIVLITPRDTDVNLCQKLGRRWSESLFEGVSYDQGANCYLTVILHNNQFAVSIVVPDEPWLDISIKERIHQEIA